MKIICPTCDVRVSNVGLLERNGGANDNDWRAIIKCNKCGRSAKGPWTSRDNAIKEASMYFEEGVDAEE